MKIWIMTAFLAACFAFAPAVSAQEAPQKWVMAYGKSIAEKEGVEDFIALIKECRKQGYTHVFFDEVYNQTLRAMPPKYFENIAQVKKAAEEAGIVIVPGIFNVGYSWRIIWYDSNLAAGLPVKDAPFVVENGAASADPRSAPPVQNGGFDTGENGVPADWKPREGSEVCISLDGENTHGGSSSLKMADFGQLATDERGRPGSCSVVQSVPVEPFKYYRLTIWRKTSDLRAAGSSVDIAASDGKRRLCYTNFEIDPVNDWEDFVTPTSDWKMFQLTFNTLESTSIDISVGVSSAVSGTVWWDDLKVEPAGLANLLRSETKPFTVKSADGSTVYEEGRDYLYVEDSLMGKSPMPAWLSYLPPGGSFDIWHEGPKIRLTPESGIGNGDKVLVSYYHPHIVYGHQVVGSLTDPRIFDIFEEQMRYMIDCWDAPAYFMGYDEIRCGGWEVQPGGTAKKVNELLADHVARAVEIAETYAPEAKLWIWSDMFTPFHNARRIENGHGYYLCNGDFYGAWEGLPPQVGIVNWSRGSREALDFFADRGHDIIMSGGNRGRVDSTAVDGAGMKAIKGFMYTNWQSDFSGLGEYSRAIDEAWPKIAGQAEAQ